MVCIFSTSTDPYFNLATEEYLLKNSEEDVFMVWKSQCAVISGKHQNILAEINYSYVRQHQIPVARRLTGGGTVFHDTGNINFSFIRNGVAGKLVDFNAFIFPVIRFLESQGITAFKGPKHEILVNGLKVSGNAEHVYKNRTLHHGTLLYNANLEILHLAITRDSGTYTDKAVQSNRSSVINLAGLFKRPVSADQFMRLFFDFVLTETSGKTGGLSEHDSEVIHDLVIQKYGTWEWIYGWSPDYTYRHLFVMDEKEIKLELNTHRGIINSCRFDCEGFSPEISRLAEALTGKRHEEEEISNVLQELNYPFGKQNREKLLYAFF